MNLREDLLTEVRKGLEGKNGSIPFPVAKLDEYLDIAKNTNYLIVGDTGSGKSTLAQDLIINILSWYFENIDPKLKLSIIYLGMERKQYNYSAKWVSRMIFTQEGIYIPVKKILGRLRKRDPETGKLTKEYDLLTEYEIELVERYSRIFDMWQEDDVFICIEGTHNPTGIKKYIDEFAKKHGELKDRESGPLGKQVYTSNHENHIVLVVTDYVGVLDKERSGEDNTKKSRLDIYSANQRRVRDVYGFSPINIQQLSRQLHDTTRLKLNDVKPKLSDIADTSELARDADVVLAIFEPWRYLPEDTQHDILGYDLRQLKDEKGYKYYRSLHILKSSFDGDGIVTGCAFEPKTGIIKAMPKKAKEMTEEDYQFITSSKYFL
jgi:replicative DNA helicase